MFGSESDKTHPSKLQNKPGRISVGPSPSSSIRNAARKSVFLYAIGQEADFSMIKSSEEDNNTSLSMLKDASPERGSKRRYLDIDIIDEGIEQSNNTFRSRSNISRRSRSHTKTQTEVLDNTSESKLESKEGKSEKKKNKRLNSTSKNPKVLLKKSGTSELRNSNDNRVLNKPDAYIHKGRKLKQPVIDSSETNIKTDSRKLSRQGQSVKSLNQELATLKDTASSIRRASINLEKAVEQTDKTKSQISHLTKEIENVNMRLASFESIISDLFQKFDHFYSIHVKLEEERVKDKELISTLIKAQNSFGRNFYSPLNRKTIDTTSVQDKVSHVLARNPTNEDSLDILANHISPSASLLYDRNRKMDNLSSYLASPAFPVYGRQDNSKLANTLTAEERLPDSNMGSFLLPREDSRFNLLDDPNESFKNSYGRR